MMKLLKYITLTFLLLCSFLLSYFIFNDEGRYYLNESESESMSDYYKEIFESEYEKVKQKVKPYIVKAKIVENGKELVGEVIEDKQNGKEYHLIIDNEDKWYLNYYVTILANDETKNKDSLSAEEIELYVNNSTLSSKTNYLIWVDLYRIETYVLQKNDNHYFLIKRLNCASGANITPTKRGIYTIGNKGTHFYGRDNTYICYNYLQYSGSYLLHSFPYSLDKKVLDNRLKERVSNGCIRYSFDDSKYLYDNIPINSTIWIN
ncbi:MAG: L,D-transpeptidase [Candidatus Caccosoma sp.]|nr:L,D-transpeptidase [Candidatus Caccosoma sp.]